MPPTHTVRELNFHANALLTYAMRNYPYNKDLLMCRRYLELGKPTRYSDHEDAIILALSPHYYLPNTIASKD